MRGRTVQVPAGVSMEDARALEQKFRDATDMRSVMQSLSESEQNAMRQIMAAAGGGRGGRQGQGGGQTATDAALMGGSYTVFVLRDGFAEAVPVRTGLTDLDYSEVVEGLAVGDTVLVLPSSSLLASQQQMQERLNRIRGGMPGISRR